MAVKLSVEVRNARLDAIEPTIGGDAILRLLSGSAPANTAAPETGIMVCEIQLPTDWMDAAASGTISKLGTWSGVGDAAAGTGTVVGYFRIYDITGTTCHIQGSVTIDGGSGDMTLDNVNIAENQLVNVLTFNMTDGNG